MRFEGKPREKLVAALNSFLREPDVSESTKEKVREAKTKLSLSSSEVSSSTKKQP
jgi:hypothetical protein